MNIDTSKSAIKLGLYAGIVAALLTLLLRFYLTETFYNLSVENQEIMFFKSVYVYLSTSTLLVSNHYDYTPNEILNRLVISQIVSGLVMGLIIVIFRENIPGEFFFQKSMYVNLVYWIITDIFVAYRNFNGSFSFLLSLFLIPLTFSYIYSKIFDKLV